MNADDATALIPVFVHADSDPRAYVLFGELVHSCLALAAEEGTTAHTPMLDFERALNAAGYRIRNGHKVDGKRTPKRVWGCRWNSPDLAAEARANRLAASAQRNHH